MPNLSRYFWMGLVLVGCALPPAATAQEAGPIDIRITPDVVAWFEKHLVASRGGSANVQSPGIEGSWRLESWTLANGSPRCSEEEGSVSGQLVYTSDGHMSAQLGCAQIDLSDLSDLSPQEVRRRLSRRHLSYYGAYTLDESARTVTHHVVGSSNVGMVGTDQVRSFAFEGNDRIVLSPPGGAQLLWLRNR